MNITKVHMSARRTFNHPYEPYANFQFGYTVEAELDGPEDIDDLRAHVETVAEVHKQDILHDLKLDRERGAVEELLADAEKWREEVERQKEIVAGISSVIADFDGSETQKEKLQQAARRHGKMWCDDDASCIEYLKDQVSRLQECIDSAHVTGPAHVEELKASLATFPPRRLPFAGLTKRVHPGHPDHPATGENPENPENL